jgi:catechol 2,3-dioxygenase-like lactoylglutathione lyase family enzyme
MQKVIGLGGVFICTQDKAATHAWYEKHLGIKLESWGAVFQLDEVKAQSPKAYNVFSFFPHDTDYVKPSTAGFMLNLIVADLDALLVQLKQDGIEVLGYQGDEFGKFAWIMDPHGVKIELWEP